MKILIVDDDDNLRDSLVSFFALRDIESQGAASYEEGLAACAGGSFDAALLDIRLADRDGIELLKEIKAREPELPVLMISGHADIKTALEAIRIGALDFLEKPLDQGRLEALIGSLKDRAELRLRAESLEDAWLEEHIVGRKSPAMRQAINLARRAATSSLCVLIQGPTGSGKELFARYVQLCSPRAKEALVAVNCAAIPSELFESELFGHKRGAFTGAGADRAGYFQAASGGTLFLDEIGEIPLALQAKLLRVLEYGEVQRLGSTETEKVNVRVIAATNLDLGERVRRGAFREDLFFRLAQVRLSLPPLEERREDLAELINHFIRTARDLRPEQGAEQRRLEPEAEAYLLGRAWKGNVRELKNLMERAAWLCDENPISLKTLSEIDSGSILSPSQGGASPVQPTQNIEGSGSSRIFRPSQAEQNADSNFDLGRWPLGPLKDMRQEFDRRYIEAALEAHGGSVSKTAQALGLLPNNLSREIRNLGLKRSEATGRGLYPADETGIE